MTDHKLEAQRQEVEYLFTWFYSRSDRAFSYCTDLTNPYIDREQRNQMTREVGGRIRDMEKMIVKLRTEWDKFLKMKKKVNV